MPADPLDVRDFGRVDTRYIVADVIMRFDRWRAVPARSESIEWGCSFLTEIPTNLFYLMTFPVPLPTILEAKREPPKLPFNYFSVMLGLCSRLFGRAISWATSTYTYTYKCIYRTGQQNEPEGFYKNTK